MGEIYGMLNNTAPITNEELSDNQIIQLLDAIAPDTSVIVSVTSTPTSTSPYTTKCAGWYVLLADTTTKRYLYINGKQTPYSIPANNSSVSVFLAKGDSIYWSGALTVVYSQKFIPARGCKYQKSLDEELDDILG